jgi:deoxyribose-phosphate aldolase
MSMPELKARIEAAAAAQGGPLGQLISAGRAAPFAHPERLDLPSIFDQTLLKPELTADEIDDAAAQAQRYGFATLVVHPIYLERLAACLAGSTTLPGSVVGFPYGANLPEIRTAETRALVDAGARELDTVLPVGLFKMGEYEQAAAHLISVIRPAHDAGVTVKVIIETGLLLEEEKLAAAWLVEACGGDFVKTCTGLHNGFATVEDIHLLRQAVGGRLGVKASGGLRTLEAVIAMVEAGANRIGTSRGVSFAEEWLDEKTRTAV